MGDTASECKRDRERERDAWTIQSSQINSLKAKWIIQKSRHINVISMLSLAMTNALSSTHFTRYSYIHPLHVLTWMENRSKPFKLQYAWRSVRMVLSSVPSAICWLLPTGGNVQRNTGPKISSSSSRQSSSRRRSEEAQTLKEAARNVAIGLCTFCSCVFTHIKGSRPVCKRKLNSWLRIDLVKQSIWWFQSMKLKYEKRIIRIVSAEM